MNFCWNFWKAPQILLYDQDETSAKNTDAEILDNKDVGEVKIDRL